MDTLTEYREYLAQREQLAGDFGFAPRWMPDAMYPFQRHLTEWALRKGRAAIFADCGLGKTIMQLAWAENVVRESAMPVLLLTPLAVGYQTAQEGERFGIECHRSNDGQHGGRARVVVANYEKLHKFNSADFAGVVCDESSILKNADGATRDAVTAFMRKMKYRLLCTATAAPNDYPELGTSSEALGYLGHMDMLEKFFRSADATNRPMDRHRWNRDRDPADKWRFRGHSERDFWRWVCSWARACRKPSDLGFSDAGFALPQLIERQHVVAAKTGRADFLIELPAITLEEQRDERKRTIQERCEKAAALAGHDQPVVSWCHLNAEGDLLAQLIPGAVQVSGSDDDDAKEAAYIAFAKGQVRALVTKPRISGFGLNWQHCAHQTVFPSHSFEQYYQSVRRCWRFGQTRPVTVDVVTSECESAVLANMQRKQRNADKMFAQIVELMNNELTIKRPNNFTKSERVPTWL